MTEEQRANEEKRLDNNDIRLKPITNYTYTYNPLGLVERELQDISKGKVKLRER